MSQRNKPPRPPMALDSARTRLGRCGGELVWPTGSLGRAGLDLRLTCSSCGWKRGAQPAPIPGEPLRIPVVLAYGELPAVEHPLTSALDGAGVGDGG